MATKKQIDDFLGERVLAVAGVSRTGKAFGNAVANELSAKGYTIYAVNPNTDTVPGRACYRSLRDLPAPVGGLIAVVPPAQTEQLVREAHEIGIARVWMQQGAESQEAIRYCKEHAMEEIHGECVLMFAHPPTSIHKFHRTIRRFFGRLPK